MTTQIDLSSSSGIEHHGWIAGGRGKGARRDGSAQQLAVTTRPTHDDDAMLLFELYASAHADELSRTLWRTPQQRQFLRMQAQIQDRYHASRHHHLDRRTVCVNGFSAGRLLVDRSPSAFTVVDIALLPDFRGRGIGTLLMRDVLAEAAALDVPVRMTIPKGHRALSWCQRVGFAQAEDLGDKVTVTSRPGERLRLPDAAAG